MPLKYRLRQRPQADNRAQESVVRPHLKKYTAGRNRAFPLIFPPSARDDDDRIPEKELSCYGEHKKERRESLIKAAIQKKKEKEKKICSELL